MPDPFERLASPDFARTVKAVADDMRNGIDYEPAEVAERLGLPLDFLMACAATWLANSTGRPVVVLPVEDGGPLH